jgi:hypothetical protein
MQEDAAKSQAGTLREWASQWRGEGAEGAAEAAFLLERAARQIERTIGIIVEEPSTVPAHDEALLGALRE